MGEKATDSNGKLVGEVDKQTTGTGTGTDGDSASTASSRSGNGGRGTGESNGGRTEGRTEKEVIPQLVTVDTGLSEEDRKREERNAKRRERYAKQKAENGQSVKPRKVNQNKKQQTDAPINREQINALVITVFGIIASRPNCEQWALTESEVDAITKPLCSIIAESEKLEAIAQNSNQIALAVACVSVFAPRLMVTVQKAKTEREKKNNARKAEQTKADTEKLNREHSGRNATNGEKSGEQLPFFGLPVN